MFRQDGEPVHVPAPAIKRGNERANNVALFFCDEHRLRIAVEEGPESIDVVGRTRMRLGLAPQVEKSADLAGSSRSDQDPRDSAHN
jgi:hypothetical protein